MKKHLLLAATAILLFGSCKKKDRVCICTVPAKGEVKEQKFTYPLDDTKKGKARRACKAAEEQYDLAEGSCELH